MAIRKNGVKIDSSWFNSLQSQIDELRGAGESFDVTGGQTATALEGLVFDGSIKSSVMMRYEIAGPDVMSNGNLALQYSSGAWRSIDAGAIGEAHGLEFSMETTGSEGALSVAAPGLTGAYTLKLTWSTFDA